MDYQFTESVEAYRVLSTLPDLPNSFNVASPLGATPQLLPSEQRPAASRNPSTLHKTQGITNFGKTDVSGRVSAKKKGSNNTKYGRKGRPSARYVESERRRSPSRSTLLIDSANSSLLMHRVRHVKDSSPKPLASKLPNRRRQQHLLLSRKSLCLRCQRRRRPMRWKRRWRWSMVIGRLRKNISIYDPNIDPAHVHILQRAYDVNSAKGLFNEDQPFFAY